MDTIKTIQDKNELKRVFERYEEDFPEAERFSTQYIVKHWKNGSIIANVLYRDDQILAYSLCRNIKNYLYLSYLAVDKNFRDQGIGSAYIKALANAYPSKTILVDIEQVEDLNDQSDMRTKRANFYLKNDYKFTPITSKIWGVKYNIMAFGNQPGTLTNDYLQMQQEIQGPDFEDKVDVFVHGKCIKNSQKFEQ